MDSGPMIEERTGDAVPIACILPDDELAVRGEELQAQLFSGVTKVGELADGYAFTFPGDDLWVERLLQFVAAERKCCPFFTFELSFAPGGGEIVLRLRGSADIKRFIEQSFLPV